MKEKLFLLLLLTSFSSLSGKPAEWLPVSKLNHWRAVRNLEQSFTPEGMLLKVTGKAPRLVNSKVNFSSWEFNSFEIEYKANKCPSKTNGNLFFINSSQQDFTHNQSWRLPSLISDNKWHTMSIKANDASIRKGVEKWEKCGNISRLRLDIMNQGEGNILIRRIAFCKSKPLYPLRTFDWPRHVKPDLKNFRPHRITNISPYWGGYMIKALNDVPKKVKSGGNFSLRRKFKVPDNIGQAFLQIAADNYFEVFLNGRKVISHYKPNAWQEPVQAEVSKYLDKGSENILAVKYRNTGGPGGVIFELAIYDSNNKICEKIESDASVICADGTPEGWKDKITNESSWKQVILQTPPPAAPWMREIPYKVLRPFSGNILVKGISGELVFKNGRNPCFNIEIAPTYVPQEHDEITVNLISGNGLVFGKTFGKLKDFKLLKKGNGNYQITVSNFEIPEFCGSRKYNVLVEMPGKNISFSDKFKNTQITYSGKAPVHNRTLSVKKRSGNPCFYLNGKPFYPIMGSNIGFPEKMASAGYEKIPADIIGLGIGGRSPNWWLGPGKYDFTEVDLFLNAAIKQYPRSMLFLWLWAVPEKWWVNLNPKHTACFNDGTKYPYYIGGMTFSSEKYRQEMTEALKVLVKYMENNYGDIVTGYTLCGGATQEWQSWGAHRAHLLNKLQDYSPVEQENFKSWLSENYPEFMPESGEVSIPGLENRLAGNGTFRSPAKQMLAILYDQFHSEAIAGSIIRMAEAVKEAGRGQKVVGTYYGYLFEYGNLDYRVNAAGHNALRKVLDCKSIDYICSPPSYGCRGIGYAGMEMKPFASINQAGKLSIQEDDTRTHNARPTKYSQTLNAKQTQALMRRNFGHALSRLQPICLLSLETGTEFNTPQTINDAGTVKRTGQYLLNLNAKTDSQIAIVVDEQSLKYLTYSKKRHKSPYETASWYDLKGNLNTAFLYSQFLTGELYYYMRQRLSQIGTPADYILYDDIEKNIGKYKMWLFLNTFRYTKKFASVIRELHQTDSTLVWLYAPGFIDKDKFSTASMENLTRIKFDVINKPSPAMISLNKSNGKLFESLNFKQFGVACKLNPLFCVNDPESKTLGRYVGNKLPAFTVKRTGKAKSYFIGTCSVPHEVLKWIAQRANIHIYLNSSDNFFEGAGIITVHANQSGQKTVKLKKKMDAVDIFSRRVICRDKDTFKIRMDSLDTKVIFVGNADNFLKHTKIK